MAQDALSDGFVKLCISDGLNFFDGKCRVLIEGQFIPVVGSEVVADTITRVLNTRDIEAQFGVGSVLSEALKKVMCACPSKIDLFALPRADAAASVASVYTLTITGPATSDGRFTLFMGDSSYNIDFTVTSGDTATQIAAELVTHVLPSFPFTAVAAAGVVTFTAKNKGTIGNWLIPIYNWAGRANYAPVGVDVAFAHTVVGSVDPAGPAAGYSAVIGECCYSCYALLSDNEIWQTAFRDHIRDAWDCTKPQCFGNGYTFNAGTLGQILATGDNSPELSRMAHCAEDPIFPYLKVANYTGLSCCSACDHPEASIQGKDRGLLSCVAMPQTCEVCFTFDEQEQLKANGFVVTGPANIGSGALTNPYIFNDVTNYLYDELGRPNATFRDTSSRRLAAATAVSLATQLQTFNGLGLYTKNTTLREGTVGTTPRMMLASIRTWAKSQIGILFSEFDNLDEDLTLQTDFQVQPPCVGVPGVMHLNMRYRPPVRISRINTNLSPALFDNCDR